MTHPVAFISSLQNLGRMFLFYFLLCCQADLPQIAIVNYVMAGCPEFKFAPLIFCLMFQQKDIMREKYLACKMIWC